VGQIENQHKSVLGPLQRGSVCVERATVFGATDPIERGITRNAITNRTTGTIAPDNANRPGREYSAPEPVDQAFLERIQSLDAPSLTDDPGEGLSRIAV